MQACPLTSTAAEIRRLEGLQPGQDGGTKKTRAEVSSYNKVGMAAASPAVHARVIQECMCAIKSKTSTKAGMSETQFNSVILGKARTLSRCQGIEDRAVGALLPKHYRSVLSLLEGEGVMKGFMKEGESAVQIFTLSGPTLTSVHCHQRSQQHMGCFQQSGHRFGNDMKRRCKNCNLLGGATGVSTQVVAHGTSVF